MNQHTKTHGADALYRSIVNGLSQTPKYMEPRWLYDGVGAKLFEAITKLDHYYLTRTESAILAENAPSIAGALGEGVTIVEPGSGEALKVRPLLEALGENASAYVPIDIAAEQLRAVEEEMSALYPKLKVEGVAADFFAPFAMPRVDNGVVFFPGSTIGNMRPADGVAFLTRICDKSGATRVLIGYDLVKDRPTMVEAYDDPAGITAAFKKNILQRLNRELGADFDVRAFRHTARFNEETLAIEMRLQAMGTQTVTIGAHTFTFEDGEYIHTEDSRKYTLETFAAFAAGAGLSPVRTWSDPDDYFAVTLLERTTG
ncbi:MAG: L-histidine N(alpha)-methyltransferase [Pseudomonadota bacterium]